MPTPTRNAIPEARPAPSVDPARRARIAIAAYYRAERRGFAPGHEIEDWLEAERELDRAPAAGAGREPEAPAGTEIQAKTRSSRGTPRRTSRR